MKYGLVFGKFMPLHRGHIHLIDTAASKVDHLTVVICSTSLEPIDGKLRLQWLKKVYGDVPFIKIIHSIEDHIPLYPHGWNEWLEHISLITGKSKYDMVFSSEGNYSKAADFFDAEEVIVDLDRNRFPISGTMIRENPYKYWEYIPGVVKPHYNKKVLVYGSESTGKTTLTKKLARYFDTSYCLEYAREYMEEYDLSNHDLDHIHFLEIGLGQNKEIIKHSHSPKTNKVFFADTDVYTTYVYGLKYLPDQQMDKIKLLLLDEARKIKWDLVLFTDIDLPWVDDGLRDLGSESLRTEMHNLFKQILIQEGISYIDISGTYEERFNIAIKAVENLF